MIKLYKQQNQSISMVLCGSARS